MKSFKEYFRLVENDESDIRGLKSRTKTVKSAAFRTWFGGSEAVDEFGNPWICYHGTRHVFDIFDPSRTGQTTDEGWFGEGIYLTPDPELASNYASMDDQGNVKVQGHLMPLYVRALNPFKTDQCSMSRQHVAEIIEDGHDAIFYYNYRHDSLPKEIIVFKPNQVKSALSNKKFTDSAHIGESLEKQASDMGFNIDAFHGTDKKFDAFDPRRTGDIGIHFGTVQQATHFTRNMFSPGYKEGGNIIPVKLKLKNPLRVKDMFSTLKTRYIARAKTWCLETPGFRPNSQDREKIFDLAKLVDKARARAGGEWGALNPNKKDQQIQLNDISRQFWKAIEQSCIHQGYDGLVYNNKAEGKGDSYVVFHANQVRARHASFDPKKQDSENLLDHETVY